MMTDSENAWTQNFEQIVVKGLLNLSKDPSALDLPKVALKMTGCQRSLALKWLAQENCDEVT